MLLVSTRFHLGRFSVFPLLLAFGVSFATSAAPPDKKAERLWKGKCASCHGPEGKGDTEQGKKMAVADMTSKAWQSSHTDAQMRKAILDGVKIEKNGVKKEMEAYKDTLQPEQVDALIKFMRGLSAG